MKNKELLPCPFCGGEGYMLHGAYNKNYSGVICSNCGVETIMFYTPDEAIKFWNTRANTIPVGNGKDYEVVQEDGK